MDEINRVTYLSNFEQLVVDYGVGLQHVFAYEDEPCFSYTVGLFEHDHPEFIMFGIGQDKAQTIMNDLALRVVRGELRFAGNTRVHQLFRDAHGYLIAGADRERDYLGTAYSIRDRRHCDRAHHDLELLQVVFADPAGRFPWDVGSDYVTWPLFGSPPNGEVVNLTLTQEAT